MLQISVRELHLNRPILRPLDATATVRRDRDVRGRLGLDTSDGICGAMNGVSSDVHSLEM